LHSLGYRDFNGATLPYRHSREIFSSRIREAECPLFTGVIVEYLVYLKVMERIHFDTCFLVSGLVIRTISTYPNDLVEEEIVDIAKL
jgi:hypothetical protein